METKDYQLHPDYWIKRPLDDSEKDWLYADGNWLEGYKKSVEHPHRALIIDAMKKLAPFESVMEIGVNCGPNLMRIREVFPGVKLAGIDLNADAIEFGKKLVSGADLRVGNFADLPWPDKNFDIGLADAVLMYASADSLDAIMKEFDRVVKKAMIIVDRFDESEKGIIKNHIWTRNYSAVLQKLGYAVSSIKLDEKTWPGSMNWQKYGYVFIGVK